MLTPRHFRANPVAALLAALLLMLIASPAFAQREVKFPPATSPPPPPMKTPPRTQSNAEDTGILPDAGPSMRKSQQRTPPPPTNLTVMYKVQYGETLKYVWPDGTVQVFPQWESYKNDGYQLVNNYVNHRLADGNNYEYNIKALSSPGFDPVDIPILYMTGDYDFVFSKAEIDNLRRFILDGGTIIFNAARGRDEFSFAVSREMKRVFPQKAFIKLSLDHPIFNSRYRIKQVLTMVNGVQFMQPPEVYSMDIGTRAAAILIPGGMGAAWSDQPYHPAGKHIVGESAVRLGVNVVAYVLGSTEYGRFLAQQFPIYNGATRPGDVLHFAQARYAGPWDENPAIQNAVLQGIKDNTGIDVDYTPVAVTLDSPDIGNYPIVFMTGHYDFDLNQREVDNLKGYLSRGGFLFASAAAGLKPFDIAIRREMKKVFPNAEFIRLPPTHAIFAQGWNPIDRVDYTPTALRDDPSLAYPEFYGLFVDNRLVAVTTPLDIMSGLNRESNAYAKGLTPDDALRVAINVITYALSH
ncbi:MAG: DUF4159 domain-containing protein [Planctomycetes bacterium]|nr:DUF4159 domain-containing protein [Planctomycetota bacterium]